jgi:hypothetical protein
MHQGHFRLLIFDFGLNDMGIIPSLDRLSLIGLYLSDVVNSLTDGCNAFGEQRILNATLKFVCVLNRCRVCVLTGDVSWL